jgi:hypothetical protein
MSGSVRVTASHHQVQGHGRLTLVTENLRNRYFFLTTANPHEGTFSLLSTRRHGMQRNKCRIPDRLLFAKIKIIRKEQ